MSSSKWLVGLSRHKLFQWKLVFRWISNSSYSKCRMLSKRCMRRQELNLWTKIKWRNNWIWINNKCKIKVLMEIFNPKLTNQRLTINLKCLKSYKVLEWETTLPVLTNSGIKSRRQSKNLQYSSLKLCKVHSNLDLIATNYC